MQRANVKVALLSLIAVLSGIAIHFTNPVTAIILFVFWIVAAFFSFAVITVGLFRKKFRFWYLIGFFPFLTGYAFETGIRSYKHKMALKLKTQIEQYKTEHGKYPESLTNLNSEIKLSGLTYSINSTLTNYRIEYLMDPFNREYFDSKSKKWGTLGWND